ncbi:unnamed protein product [Rotaria sordida]|uniref:Uncharacterized protein n=1 Tax=Rotaria sordida TaxID=392033 RepID=A0A814ADV1_9BILA|nr:unnamed protein product [Rotaria sordida]
MGNQASRGPVYYGVPAVPVASYNIGRPQGYGGYQVGTAIPGYLLMPPRPEYILGWHNTGSMNNAQFWHTASILINGYMLVTGESNSGALNSSELYYSSQTNKQSVIL